MGEGQFQLEHK